MSQSTDGPADIYTNVIRRANKQHVCCACGLSIQRGHRYHVITVLFDGLIDTFKRCIRCEKIHAHLVEKILADGDLDDWPNEQLDCGHDYEEAWNDQPPAEIARLAFVTPEEMQVTE